MKYKNLTIEFGNGSTEEVEEVDELAMSMNGYLSVTVGEKRSFYRFDDITAYHFTEVAEETGEGVGNGSNIHLLQ